MITTLDLPFQLGETQMADGIAVTPLFPRRDPVCDYVTLDEALGTGLQIGEIDDQGDVTQLLVKNPLTEAVLLYDGEELVGAKQNRILNVTVLVAAKSATRIPVSCVEQGRWSWRGRSFSSAGHVVGPEVRAFKAASLRADALALGAAQGEVWAAVGEQLAGRGVASPTGANADGFAFRRTEIDDLASRFPLQPGQCGLICTASGKGWGVDYVSRPAAFSRLYPKLLAGFVFDAIGSVGPMTEADDVVAVLAAAQGTSRPSVSLGNDVRLEGKSFLGSGLTLDEELVQLSAYGVRP
jgi:hypothetical protein